MARRRLTFDEAVKATKFLVFTSVVQTFISEDSDKAMAGQYILASMSLDDDGFLAPEWQCKLGATLEDISLYEGDKLVYAGKVRTFCASKYCQDYLHRIAHVWKAGKLINEMNDAMVKLMNPHKGDFNDTVVYEIWKKHMQRGPLPTE